MSSTNQLLLKALSTDSEDEAISCLRMARKRGKAAELNSTSEYNGKSAEYWYNKAQHYYTEAKQKKPEGLSKEQQTMLYNMYRNAEYEKLVLAKQLSDLQAEKNKLAKEFAKKKTVVGFSVFFGTVFIIVSLIPMLI